MQLHEEFAGIAKQLNDAIVDKHLPANAFQRNQDLNKLTNQFIDMVEQTGLDITPTDQPGFPSLRTAIVQLHDATNLWKNDGQTVFYAQRAAKELKAFLA